MHIPCYFFHEGNHYAEAWVVMSAAVRVVESRGNARIRRKKTFPYCHSTSISLRYVISIFTYHIDGLFDIPCNSTNPILDKESHRRCKDVRACVYLCVRVCKIYAHTYMTYSWPHTCTRFRNVKIHVDIFLILVATSLYRYMPTICLQF
jgi:hypothetical protein